MTCQWWMLENELCCITTPCDNPCDEAIEVGNREHTEHCVVCKKDFKFKGGAYPPEIRSYGLCHLCRNIVTGEKQPEQEYLGELNGCNLCGSPTSELAYGQFAAICKDDKACEERVKTVGLADICSLCNRWFFRQDKEFRIIICKECVEKIRQ